MPATIRAMLPSTSPQAGSNATAAAVKLLIGVVEAASAADVAISPARTIASESRQPRAKRCMNLHMNITSKTEQGQWFKVS
jgi:hypothetical protein